MVNRASSTVQKRLRPPADLQATLNAIPACAFYADPSGALKFVNERFADLIGLSKDHPLRLGTDTGTKWDSLPTLLHPDDQEETQRSWSTCIDTGAPSQLSFRVRNAEGSYRWFLCRAEPVRTSDGTLLYWIGVSLDIEEQKQAEVEQSKLTAELRRSEFYLAQGQRLGHAGSWSFKPDLTCDYWSKELYEILGFDPKSGIPTISDYLTRVHPEDREIVEETIHRMVAAGEGCDIKKRIIRPRGVQRVIRCVGMPVQEDGIVTRFVGTLMDITEQEELTRELRRSKTHLAHAQTLSRTGSVGMEVSTGKIFWSDEAARIYGYPPGTEPTPELILQRSHPDDLDILKDVLARAAEGGADFDFEHRLLMPDGSIKYLHNFAHSFIDEMGNEEIVGAIMDITERRAAEEALRESEYKLRQIIATIPAHLWSLNPDGEPTYISQSFLDYCGNRGLEDVEHGRWGAFVHPDDLPETARSFQHAIRTGTSHRAVQRIRRADGEFCWHYTRAEPLHGREGRIVQWYGVSVDIDKEMKAEEQLRRSEAYLAEAQRLSLTGSFGWKPDSGEIIWSDETYRIFEFDRDTTPTIDLSLDRVHPEDRAGVQSIIERASEGVNDFDHTFRLLLPDGRVKHVHALAHSTQDASGSREFVGAVTDVTDRKRSEQRLVAEHTVTRALAESGTFEEVTSKILQAVCECLSWDLGQLWLTDRATGGLRCVDVWHKESLEAAQFVASSHDSTFLPGIGLPGRVWSSLEPAYILDVVQDTNFPRASVAVLAGLHAAFAFPLVLGSEFLGVMEFFSHEIRQPDQDLLNLMTNIGSQIGQFIERTRAEEELRQNEAYLAEAQRLSRTGSWAWSPMTDSTYFSQECYRLLGFETTGPPPQFENIIERIHPDDQASSRELVEKGIRDKVDFELDYRIILPNKGVRDIHCVCRPVFDRSGDLHELVGTIIDITEHKAAEEKIREQEMELRQILDLTPQLVTVLGPNRERIFANRVALDYLGMTLDEWQDRSIGDEIHPDDLERLRADAKRALSNGTAFEIELRVRKGDGSYRWFLARYNPVLGDDGQIMRWYTAWTDIEDRKIAEEKLQQENIALREEIDKASMFEEIVGESPALRKVLMRVSKVAPTDSTVLITGETGTGKELIARAIHKRSKRSARAFVAVNCAAIPEALIASELFGHEKGSFTGAMRRRVGKFEAAEGGTIFLDEVGDLPAETQVALLRVLQEHEFERVGGNRPISSNVRVVTATNRDLQAAIAAGEFRSDLYYRLNIFPIELPPLRERKPDIPLLAEYFIDRYSKKAGKRIKGISKKTLDLLISYHWPGNIRELQNVIERSLIVNESENFTVDVSWLVRGTHDPQAATKLLSEKLRTQEKTMIEAALAESGGRVAGPSGAASKLGIPVSTLESKIKSLKIAKHRFKLS